VQCAVLHERASIGQIQQHHQRWESDIRCCGGFGGGTGSVDLADRKSAWKRGNCDEQSSSADLSKAGWYGRA
jgi:hypothetical protein